MRRALEVLLFKPCLDGNRAPAFLVVAESHVRFWQQFGWFVLCTERDIRYADLEDVRREDESRWRRE